MNGVCICKYLCRLVYVLYELVLVEITYVLTVQVHVDNTHLYHENGLMRLRFLPPFPSSFIGCDSPPLNSTRASSQPIHDQRHSSHTQASHSVNKRIKSIIRLSPFFYKPRLDKGQKHPSPKKRRKPKLPYEQLESFIPIPISLS